MTGVKRRTWIVLSLVVPWLMLLVAAPRASFGADLTLVSPPLGFYPTIDTRLRAGVVNVGEKPVVATIHFCDADGTCVTGLGCVNIPVASRRACQAEHTPSLDSNILAAYVKIQVSGPGPIRARGSFWIDDGLSGGAVEAQ